MARRRDTLVPRRSLRLGDRARRLTTVPVDLDPQAASITVRIPRPTSANPRAWGDAARVKVTIVVEVDGERHHCTGTARGGIMVDRRRGREGLELETYSLTWNLPTGFFARGGEPREQWQHIRHRRWGETATSSYRAWVELESDDLIETEVEVVVDVEPAPPMAYHSSVAYQNGTGVFETDGGDGQLSMSFTAGSGENRVAFVWGATARDERPTSVTVSFDGGHDVDLGNALNDYWRGHGILAFDSRIGSGAKTIALASSGGSGFQYSTSLGVVSFTGAHQTSHGTPVTAGANSGTALSITVATPAADSLVVDGWSWVQASSTAPAIGPDQTERVSQVWQTTGAVRQVLKMSTQPGTAGGTMSWTKQADDWEYVGMAIEIKAAATSDDQDLELPAIASTAALLAMSLALNLGAATIASATALNAPTIAGTNALSLPAIASATTLAAPTVANVDQDVGLATIPSGPTLTAPTVSAPEVQAIGLPPAIVARTSTRIAFPVAVHSSGRYIIDAEGRPVFVHGNAVWSILKNLTLEEAEGVLDSLLTRGFNAIIVSTTDTFDRSGNADYPDHLPNRDNEPPFSSGLTPNEPYWANVDAVFEACLKRGILIFLSISYLGISDDEGIRALFQSQSDASCKAYGTFIGQRYGHLGNIVWTHGGDTDPTPYKNKVLAIYEGLVEAIGESHLHTHHWDPDSSGYDYASDFPPSLFNLWSTYAYDTPVPPARVYDDYTYQVTKPVILYESHYENDFGGKTANDVVAYPYRAVMSGAKGHFFGNKPLWYLGTDYATALNSTGHGYMAHVVKLFNRDRAWWLLEPRRDGSFIVSNGGNPDLNTGVQGAVASDGSCAMAFFPSQLEVTVDLSVVDAGGLVRAHWFNIRTGAFTYSGTFAASGQQAFTPPSSTSQYVLVLDVAGETSATAVFPPALAVGVATPTIAATTLSAPTVNPGAVTLTGATIAAGTTLNAPTLTAGNVVAVPAIASATSLLAPTVVAGAVTVTTPTIAGGTTLNGPVVLGGSAIVVPLLGPTAVLTTPVVTPGAVSVTTPFLASAADLAAPICAMVVALPAIASGATLTTPTLVAEGGLALSTIPSTAELLAPTVAGGTVSIALPTIDGISVLYAPFATDARGVSVIEVRARYTAVIEITCEVET